MTGKRDNEQPKPFVRLHADSWIWLVATVVALSAISNAFG